MIEPSSRVYFDQSAALVLEHSRQPRRALFLDRDGVINVDHAYVHRREDTTWLPGIFDLCAAARDAGYLLVVVTNQAGIARGYYSEAEFLRYTQWVHSVFSSHSVPLLATYYCPHHPEAGIGKWKVSCRCRKPQPGMLLDAAVANGISLPGSVMVGNNSSDMLAGLTAGVGRCVLLDASVSDPALEGKVQVVRSLDAIVGILSAVPAAS